MRRVWLQVAASVGPLAPVPKRLVPLPEKARKIMAVFRSRFRIEDNNSGGWGIA
jgi:hypothetical protein